VTDEREETAATGRNTAQQNGRDAIAGQEDVRHLSTDQRERATELFRLAV